jgi:hypothetical protein
LAGTVIAAAAGLAVGTRGVDPPRGALNGAAPKLKLDPNNAPPQVLGALPQVGATLVHQLILAREERPLTSMEDLRSRVRGLGPATSDQIAPYLRFEPAAGSGPNQRASSRRNRPAEKLRAPARKKPRSRMLASAPAHTAVVAQRAEPASH